jgi:PPOX class probable F420-dependent enzyme
METQLKNKLSDPNIRKIFESKNFVFLSSLMQDGSPQVTPTWVDIEDNNILINTAIGRVKHRNVTRDPRVAIAVVDVNNLYNMVTIRGKVIDQVTGEKAEKHIDKMAQKYIGKDKYPYRTSEEKRVILKISPRSIFHMKQ